MADEKEKNNIPIPAKKDAEASKPETKVKRPGGAKKLLVFGGLGVGAIAVGIALAVFVLKPMMSDSGASETSHTASNRGGTTQEKGQAGKSSGGSVKPRQTSGHGGEASSIYTIKDIVINPAGTGGTRFLSVSFAFELQTAELEKEFEAREPVIRDALITILSSKTVAQLTDPKEKEIVRYQIGKRVAELLKTEQLAGVYYTDFVLQ
jgi:flagellar FliL protein